MKKLLACAMVVMGLAGMAMAASFEVPAVTLADPGATVLVPVSAVGEAELQGINLTLEVQGPLEITDATLIGGVFESNNTGLQLFTFGNGGAPSPQIAMANTTTNTATVAVPGVLANVSILVPAGTAEGDYFFRTEIPDFAMTSDFAGTPGVDVEGQGYGLIRVVPEPMTALMLLGAIPLLRRRRA